VLSATDKEQSRWLIFLWCPRRWCSPPPSPSCFGTLAEKYLTDSLEAHRGVGFMIIGAWTVWSHFNA